MHDCIYHYNTHFGTYSSVIRNIKITHIISVIPLKINVKIEELILGAHKWFSQHAIGRIWFYILIDPPNGNDKSWYCN